VQELTIGDTKVAVAQDTPFDVLGRITWYSVRKMRILHEDLDRILEKEGVPPNLRPRKTRDVDAFKSAVRSVEGKDYIVENETSVDPTTVRLKVDPRSMLVVSRVHDHVSDSLPVRVKATFTESKTIDFFGGDLAVHQRIENEYADLRVTYRDEDIRTMASRAIHAAYAVNVKQTGGVYFIPETFAPSVESVARVIDQLPGCEMVSLPVIDREPERKTVLKQYEKATLERIGELMNMVKETVDKGEPIVPSIYARFADEVSYLTEQRTKYEAFLNTAIGKVEIEMEVLNSNLGKLASMIKEDKPAQSG